jgi:general stress protein 26
MTTMYPDTTLHSCPMTPSPVDSEGALWFLSGSNTDKVEAVRTNQRVSLCFADPATDRYVSVSGFCELLRDRAVASELWRPEYKTWLPGGLEDENLVLMRVVVQQAEYWDAAEGRMIELSGFRIGLQ